MKKLISFVIIVCTVFAMTSCSKKTPAEKKPLKSIYEYGKQITSASAFSEGLGFVALDNNNDKAYCINKKGEVIFDIISENDEFPYETMNFCKFINGLALIDGNFYDKTGKKTTPKDVGVTAFSAISLEYGYILARKDENNVGVMDKNFNWIKEPNEKLNHLPVYKDAPIFHLYPIPYGTYGYENYLVSSDVIVNILDGKIYHTLNPDNTIGSMTGDSEMIQPSTPEEAETFKKIYAKAKYYHNGKNLVIKDENKFTMIDKQGNELFEPVSTNSYLMNNTTIQTDGKNIIVFNYNYVNGEPVSVYEVTVYNEKGKLVKTVALKDVISSDENEKLTFWTISDGIITFNTVNTKADKEYREKSYLFDADFNKLF